MKSENLSANEDILIEMALLEDLDGTGDVTSQAIFDSEIDEFHLVSKDEGVLCGRRLFEKVMAKVDPSIEVRFRFSDGDRIAKGDCIADVSGKVLSVLQGERTAINLLPQRPRDWWPRRKEKSAFWIPVKRCPVTGCCKNMRYGAAAAKITGSDCSIW